TQYVEVVLNGEYQGVYVLMEKIKRDNGRVDIARLDPDENSGDDLTGGYIIKIDKGTGTNNGSWIRDHQVSNNKSQRIQYYYEYPAEPSTQQKTYIQKYVDDFENALKSDRFTDPDVGYRKYANVSSFIKLFLLNEVSRNIDGYRISTFMYKDKDSNGGGKLTLGPPWDYDISYGNANYCQGNRFDLFAYRFNDLCPDDFWQVPFWWPRLMQDPAFISEMRDTYLTERESGGIFSDENLTNMIDELEAELQQPQARNFQKWQILGQYVWPQPEPISRTWKGEVDELRTWLQSRLKWLDANMPGVYVGSEEIPELTVTAYPNPFIDVINISLEVASPKDAVITMYDSFGREFIKQTEQLRAGKNIVNLQLPTQANLQQLQFLSVEIDGKKTVKKLVRR
ncbi:MAG: CotH kinase family protein, partial [Spirosomaceae bacterium]|nr:CotH kinase family protein [Spirosomataceae bacterium]